MKFYVTISIFLLILFYGCKKEPIVDPGIDLSQIDFDPQEYLIKQVIEFPVMEIPEDNPMTQEGVDLGRHLFYDPILSADSTQSCNSCHLLEGSFTDNKAVSVGIDGIAGKRSSMSLLNIGYSLNGLFWDGRVQTLEEQALLPVEDPIELHDDWENVMSKLQNSPLYREKFRKAFGISNSKEMTKEMTAKAIAQFERSLISSGRSKYDRWKDNKASLTELEEDGFSLFYDIPDDEFPDAQCFHCHIDPLFTDNGYFNNGMDDVPTLEDFVDLGRGAITGNRFDNGKFRVPTLRNIEFTAPYMHDGRFQTLEEVMEEYDKGGHGIENEDQNIREPFNLTDYEKEAVIAFIKTLSDTTFLNNPAHKTPF